MFFSHSWLVLLSLFFINALICDEQRMSASGGSTGAATGGSGSGSGSGSRRHRVLTLGDGNFSFSLAFAKKFTSVELTATSFDSREELLRVSEAGDCSSPLGLHPPTVACVDWCVVWWWGRNIVKAARYYNHCLNCHRPFVYCIM